MEKCQKCMKEYQQIYRLPDALWEFVRGQHNLLCMKCVEEQAIWYGFDIYWEGEKGKYPTDCISAKLNERVKVLEKLSAT